MFHPYQPMLHPSASGSLQTHGVFHIRVAGLPNVAGRWDSTRHFRHSHAAGNKLCGMHQPNINSSNCFTPHLGHLLFQFSWCQHEIILLRGKAIDIPAIQSFAHWVCHNQAVPFYMNHLPPALNHCATLQPGHLHGWAYTVLQPPLVHPQVQRLPKNSGGTCDSRLPAHQQKLVMTYKPKSKDPVMEGHGKEGKIGLRVRVPSGICVLLEHAQLSVLFHKLWLRHVLESSKLSFLRDSYVQLLMPHTHCN